MIEYATPEDFSRWRSHAETCDIGSLRFIIKDCRQVAENMRGYNPTREGYYADQAFTYADELARRLKKITPEHFNTLCQAISKSRQGMETLQEYEQEGLTAKRWRWDLLWRAERLGFLPDRFTIVVLYAYINDDHIDTALRRITGTR